MTRKPLNITNKISPIVFILGILVLWQGLISFGVVEEFLLPSPISVVKAFIADFGLLMEYTVYTLTEAFVGLFLSVILGYTIAILMDRFTFVRQALYPVLIISQTVPVIAIAPLLVLWMGYGMAPKITLVLMTCFFPITIGIYDGFNNIEKDYLNEYKVLGGNYITGLRRIKIPLGIRGFFSGFRISVSYAVVGAVISEWIGGTQGLGVYMTRVRKQYAFDRMFAVIVLISLISLTLMFIVKQIEKKVVKDVQ